MVLLVVCTNQTNETPPNNIDSLSQIHSRREILTGSSCILFLNCAQIKGCSESASAEESYLRAMSSSALIISTNAATSTASLTFKRGIARTGEFNRYT